MPDRKLDIAFWNYDRTRLLADGTVKIEGVDAAFHSVGIVPEIFKAMIKDRAYDVSELGMTYFLRLFSDDDPPFLALPVFLVRCFRHSAIYINKKKGISRPQDLAGKRIGELGLYGHDGGVMPKGVLSDEYGVTPDQCRWIVGRIDFPMKPVNFVPHPHPANVEVEWADEDTDLGEMLERGEIDALISADAPRCVLEGSPKVGRLFEDYVAVERDYFRRTGIFPIMHTVVVRKELANEPELLRTVFEGFCKAKDGMIEQYEKGLTFMMGGVTVFLTGKPSDQLAADRPSVRFVTPDRFSGKKRQEDILLRLMYRRIGRERWRGRHGRPSVSKHWPARREMFRVQCNCAHVTPHA